jgi:glutathione S-transferase
VAQSTYTLVIGNKNYSSWSLRPWIWMKQAGIEFTEKRVALFTDTYLEELEPYRSDHRVPVLVDDGFQVWDTAAILEYLAEKHPEARGWPEDAQARAVARSVSAEMHSSFSALRGALPMNCRKQFPDYPITPAVQRDVDRIVALWESCRSEYGQGGDYLFGDYTIADAMYAPVVLRFHGYDVSVPEVARDYMETVLADPHLRDWIEAARNEQEFYAGSEVADY